MISVFKFTFLKIYGCSGGGRHNDDETSCEEKYGMRNHLGNIKSAKQTVLCVQIPRRMNESEKNHINP